MKRKTHQILPAATVTSCDSLLGQAMPANCDSTWFGVGREWIRKLGVEVDLRSCGEKFGKQGLSQVLERTKEITRREIAGLLRLSARLNGDSKVFTCDKEELLKRRGGIHRYQSAKGYLALRESAEKADYVT